MGLGGHVNKQRDGNKRTFVFSFLRYETSWFLLTPHKRVSRIGIVKFIVVRLCLQVQCGWFCLAIDDIIIIQANNSLIFHIIIKI